MSRYFPDIKEADENGLLGVGGFLTPDWLLDAYTHGIFPWPFTDPRQREKPILAWFSPDPRCILEFDRFHISRRLAQTYRSGRFWITSDTDFAGVMRGCAAGPGRSDGWITPEMIAAYTELHRLGYAHSIETWYNGELAGGLYGVAVRGLFAAESMFFRERDASKVALVALMEHLRRQRFQLVDIQVISNHTARFGAAEISRREYIQRLAAALSVNPQFGQITK
ncbi:leucyl/phenylalanyl-tRNA--protein transferase [Planctomycetales bacterium]|nr:leucyl/phenylalanyl-tRNA--protein transferase [Planctomycetales bacterium]